MFLNSIGDVKIFDFGLAKELDPTKKDEHGFYNLTADTGSPRYMAPEVFLGKSYNESVDVYSFTVLIWQILQLETPFEGYTMNLLKKKVIEGGVRPKCDPKWSQPLRDMMHRGWGNPTNRPCMEEISTLLRSEMSNATYATTPHNANELDASRKSELSLLAM
jgi:serine/threonine protein kinase